MPSQIDKKTDGEIDSYVAAREKFIDIIRLELFGPDNGSDPENSINEALTVEKPLQRYKIGVLYPKPENDNDQDTLAKEAADNTELPHDNTIAASKILSKSAEKEMDEILSRKSRLNIEENEDGVVSDLAYAGLQRPASIGVSFFISDSVKNNSRLKLSLSGGIYEKSKDSDGSWYRKIVVLQSSISSLDLFKCDGIKDFEFEGETYGFLKIQPKIFVRHFPKKGILLTYTAINTTPSIVSGKEINLDSRCVFQVSLKAEIFLDDLSSPLKGISSYPQQINGKANHSDGSLDLLYRNFQTYAIGHGCSAEWSKNTSEGRVESVWSSALPSHETFNVTPVLTREDGSPIEVKMADLAGLGDDKRGIAAIDELIARYRKWIDDRNKEIENLGPEYRDAASENLKLCRMCLERIQDGRNFLEENERAQKAFTLANKAILIQQKKFTDKRRETTIDFATKRVQVAGEYESVEQLLEKDIPGKGSWRPFQIAFLLFSLRSTVDGQDPNRETVDLIWFPTGGGKTEAYFGLSAFSIIYRRLIDPKDAGVSVLMRYTLRLLTADQFERASGLICALEYIRRQDSAHLGEEPFSIGIWLGKSTTPNSRDEARTLLTDLKRPKTPNKFLVTKCPWCCAQIGPIKAGNYNQEVAGYIRDGKRIIFKCSDTRCDFNNELPIFVVDEDIYEFRPTMIIGTVDKFAQVAWDPKCRHIFGLNDQGNRSFSPPGLIIQDELHLISGPLGSIVGLYETLIEEFSTDYRQMPAAKPKIVCSTATIKRFESQVRALYARPNSSLFPCPGLDASDSFFAKWESHDKQRGRKYIGIYAPGESMQTMQVRTMSISLQAVMFLPEKFRDPWWTLVSFFNSLRELGTTITLYQSDILTRLGILKGRFFLDWPQVRKLDKILELTSRLPNNEIDGVRSQLKRPYNPAEKYSQATDVCLASNIIEVGIDIGRLSLMTIVGQPKTTAQYIQVSGRVGRNPNTPGLVLMIYGASKPRDRSHFEKFKTYHERLYAQVEPTSVTPFSGPALDRALHAVIVGYLRQTLPVPQAIGSAFPIPEVPLKAILDKINNRVARIYSDHADKDYVMRNIKDAADKFIENWSGYKIQKWISKEGHDTGLIYRAGTYVGPEIRLRSYKTLQSMRNVDQECKGDIAYPLKQDD